MRNGLVGYSPVAESFPGVQEKSLVEFLVYPLKKGGAIIYEGKGFLNKEMIHLLAYTRADEG